VQTREDTGSSSSEEEEVQGAYFKKIDDMALFIRKYHKGLKQNGYKVVQRNFPNKKKRTCYNCGSTDHFVVAKCPYEKKENNYKRGNTREDKHEYKKKTSKWGKHTLDMSGIQLKSQVMRM